MYQDGIDVGYLDDQNWWLNPEHPHAFLIQKIDDNYSEEYFKEDHVSQVVVDALYENVNRYYGRLTGAELKSVIEFGCGGGWFLKKFSDNGIRTWGIEGSEAGYKICCDRNLDCIKLDLRRVLLAFNNRYDVAICTEVAEHIEIPFSSVIAKTLTSHSDIIWFSAEEPNTNRPHIGHPNERPYKFWINLFDFYGYGCYMLPDEVFNACEGRGRMIFYNRNTITP